MIDSSLDITNLFLSMKNVNYIDVIISEFFNSFATMKRFKFIFIFLILELPVILLTQRSNFR